MSSLSQFFGGIKRKYQYFSSSGVFQPTQAMLDAGGVLELDIRGGGGGSSRYQGSYAACGGGNSKHKTMYQLTNLSPITVTIGTAGADGIYANGSDGGSTTFGTLTVPGGQGSQITVGGTGSGNEGTPGLPGFYGSDSGWTGRLEVGQGQSSRWAGSGSGGSLLYSATNGSVLVSWWERS